MGMMWSRWTIAASAAVVAGCAALPGFAPGLEDRVTALLERRGLGRDALLVIDNLLRHGPPPPRATPALVTDLLGQPLAASDAARVFGEAVPASLTTPLDDAGPALAFEELLRTYLDELAEAQRLLRAASRELDGVDFSSGLPAAGELVAAADAIDTVRLRHANRLFVDATVRFARGLRRVTDVPGQGATFNSAIGTVVVGTRGHDRYGPGAALIVDPGGDDVYERAPARGGAVSVIVDLGGNDQYRGSDIALRGLAAIVDLAGDDRYAMEGPGLAAAFAGASLLIDVSGNDSYDARFFGQGAAAFGLAALVDLAGDDRYRLEAWGQGFGIAGGVGLLWDRGGSDRYAAGGVPDPFGRGSGLSGAQGAAFGARGRLGGGIGILRDDRGDDLYEAQMFAQGSGYYYGLGLLWDRGGDDRYQAVRYAQGNGTHQALGVLRDEAGDDRYALAELYGQGMGLDVAVGILVDTGGSDSYRAHTAAQGTATANGFGLLADSGGDDRFEVAFEEHAWGRAEWLRGLPSVGVLLHAGSARFSRGAQVAATPAETPPLTVQAPSAEPCPSEDPGEALFCRVRDAQDIEGAWKELKATLVADPATPLAGWIALALARRPPSDPGEIAALLAKRESCNVRALALRAWPTLPAAQAGIRSPCFRLQAAARLALVRLGEPLPPDIALPTFLRALPPQEDTF
jgi:hypothetical protein